MKKYTRPLLGVYLLFYMSTALHKYMSGDLVSPVRSESQQLWGVCLIIQLKTSYTTVRGKTKIFSLYELYSSKRNQMIYVPVKIVDRQWVCLASNDDRE